MTRLLLALVLGGASTACALAAVGLVLYAGHPQQAWALQCFAAWGFAAGLVCGGLHLRAQGRPVQAPPALSAQELHGLVRAAEASARAAGQARGAGAQARAPVPVLDPAAGSPAPAPGPISAAQRAAEPAETVAS
jgi:hypothetical protein